jgi:hypothetical protein
MKRLWQFNTTIFRHVDKGVQRRSQEEIKTSEDAFLVRAALLDEPLPVLFSSSRDHPYNASTVGDLATKSETVVYDMEEDTNRLIREK